jgi:hypothetical protein
MSELIVRDRVDLIALPVLKRLLRERFKYKKHQCYLYVADPGYVVCLRGGYWSEGSKTDWWSFSLDNQTVEGLNACKTGFPTFEPNTHTITEATTLASTGVFCGKTATMAVYLTQAQAARMGYRIVTAHYA